MQPPAGSQVSRVPAQRIPPGQAAPGPATPPPARRRGLRLTLAVIGGTVALLCLAGAAVAYVLYDKYTSPDRSAPDVVVDNYLRAFLVDRNDVRAQLLVCSEGADLSAIQQLRAEAERRERDFDVNVKVVWGALDRTSTDRGESVQTALRIGGYATEDGTPRSSRRELWEFDLVDQEGWRICGSRKIG